MFHRTNASHFDQNTPLPTRVGLNRMNARHHTLLKPSQNANRPLSQSIQKSNFGSVRRRFGSDLTNTARRPNQSKNLRFTVDKNANGGSDDDSKPQKLLSFVTPQISHSKAGYNPKMAPMTSFVFRSHQSSMIQPKTLQFSTNQIKNKSNPQKTILSDMDSEVEMGPTESESWRPQMDPTLIRELDTAFDLIGSYRRAFMCNGASVNEYSYDNPGGDISDDEIMSLLGEADFSSVNSDLFDATDVISDSENDDSFIADMIGNDCDLPYNEAHLFDEALTIPIIDIQFDI